MIDDAQRTALWENGYARLGTLLTREQAEALRALYADDDNFRSRVDMARYRFRKGEYKYFRNPLPPDVQELRHTLYGALAPLASEWMQALSVEASYPDDLADFLGQCHAQGQTRPTPLMLHYQAGDYNCLHQDLYGAVVFPFQVVIGLSQPEQEFTGGELLLVEQRPRAQSVGHAIRLSQGEGVVITTKHRPLQGTRGYYRGNIKHGVSPVQSGERYTLGIIFHDAE